MAIRLMLGDITTVDADAIVNAANSHLLPGGGVCGAIHAAAGPELARAGRAYVAEHGPVAVGCSAIVPGFDLPARFVIHAVGPVWEGGLHGEPELLASAYRSAIELADAANLVTIAFPSISTGVFRYPVASAAPVALSAVAEALARASSVREATFVLFDAETYQAYSQAAAELGS